MSPVFFAIGPEQTKHYQTKETEGERESVPVYQIWDIEGTITVKEDRPAPIAAKPCIYC
jgi:hypothetical protein